MASSCSYGGYRRSVGGRYDSETSQFSYGMYGTTAPRRRPVTVGPEHCPLFPIEEERECGRRCPSNVCRLNVVRHHKDSELSCSDSGLETKCKGSIARTSL